ncbi:MAG TPA: N-acetylmuramoyl-L-alanine amidase [Candidatus Ozemobacteraceae bacterium]|nr:N-acetylmuramoyl-L-alanine amidase [Candidatus Ozemobacteraceae bacterium]
MTSNRVGRFWRRGLAAGAAAVLFFASPVGAQEAGQTKGFISVREFAESQGIAYQWFPMQKTLVLSRGGRSMHLTVGRTESVVDDQPLVLPSAPILQGGQLMAPARSIINVFGSQAAQKPAAAAKPPSVTITSPAEEEDEEELGPDTPAAEEEEPASPVLVSPPQVIPPPVSPPAAQTAANETPEEEDASTLVTVRHSVRDDQTRVVLEFDGPMSYATEKVGKGTVKLRINGCKNIIPTKRSNPAGRDLKNVSFHSGPDRKGLVVNFDLVEGGEAPTIETVANPYRMVLTFRAAGVSAATASAPVKLAAASATAPLKPAPAQATMTAAIPAATPAATPEKPPAATPEPPSREPAKNLRIDVPLETLSRSAFSGRAIIIDPGHGGSDAGVTLNGLAPEKQITMAIATHLRKVLRQMGFSAYLLRAQDATLSPAERQAAANKSGGDLLVSLHVGGAGDESIEGVACYSFDTNGAAFENDAGSRIPPQNTFGEWAQTTRFDLARFLSMKIRDRMVKHLSTRDRGVRPLPLLPLRFMIYPAVLVEVGMLSNPTEGPKLSNAGYQEAAARSIANGIVDFFNGIKLNP